MFSLVLQIFSPCASLSCIKILLHKQLFGCNNHGGKPVKAQKLIFNNLLWLLNDDAKYKYY